MERCLKIFKRKSNGETIDINGGGSSDGCCSSRCSSESSESSGQPPQPINASLKDFKIVRKLGHGGFGRVFLAKYFFDKTSENKSQLVALKVINKKEIAPTQTDREHVKAEYYCLRNMRHPFLVRLYCSYQTPSKLFYAMEFLQGGELFSWMEKYGKFTKVRH